VITGDGWIATMWSNYVEVTITVATTIITFIPVPVWDIDMTNASTGINMNSMTYPSTTTKGYISSNTVHVSTGSSDHLVGISFLAIVI
jgi:hypothetical protein